jgi:hypothetical protein
VVVDEVPLVLVVGRPGRSGWPLAGAGMATLVDGFEGGNADVGVELGGGQLGVA